MTMVNLVPVEVTVGCDVFTGRPRWVRVGPEEVSVQAIERIRQESAAYPVNEGPRTLFVVRTAKARLRLSFRHRERRWLMEGIDTATQPHPVAA
jgi:hypothetical protein